MRSIPAPRPTRALRRWCILAAGSVFVAASASAASADGAVAQSVVRIADGDCAGLRTQVAATPGHEPALIVLARNGTYACGGYGLIVLGDIHLDAAGATLDLTGISQTDGAASAPVVLVSAGGRLALRNASFAPLTTRAADGAAGQSCCARTSPAIVNNGTLVIDASSIAGGAFENGPGQETLGFVINTGDMTMRNVTLFANAYAGSAPALVTSAGGRIELSHATIVTSAAAHSQALLGTSGDGRVVVANSILVNDGSPAAAVCSVAADVTSLGGNVFGDDSCAGHANDDVVAADAGVLAYGRQGGVVPTLALGCDSPAVGNGDPALCEATDARGTARGVHACDAGAREHEALRRCASIALPRATSGDPHDR